MAKPRTKEFYVNHWRSDVRALETKKVRGYVRTFSASETGHQIGVGIHHAGNGWDIVELSTGLRIEWHPTLTEAFRFLQNDDIIERVWKSVNDEDKPGMIVHEAKAKIAAIKD